MKIRHLQGASIDGTPTALFNQAHCCWGWGRLIGVLNITATCWVIISSEKASHGINMPTMTLTVTPPHRRKLSKKKKARNGGGGRKGVCHDWYGLKFCSRDISINVETTLCAARFPVSALCDQCERPLPPVFRNWDSLTSPPSEQSRRTHTHTHSCI